MIIRLFLIICIAFLSFSCTNSRQRAINHLRDFTTNLEKTDSQFTPDEWEATENEYDNILNDLENHKSEYSDYELKEIGRLEGKCFSQMTVRAAKDAEDQINRFLQQADGFYKALQNL